MGSIATPEVQNFSVRYQRAELYAKQYWVSNFKKLINLISVNLKPPQFISLAMNILEGWEMSHFKGDILRHA